MAREAFQVRLDYRPQSLRQVDQLLEGFGRTQTDGLMRFLAAGGLSVEQVHEVSRIWAAFTGEVFRRQLGGEWGGSPEQPTLTVRGQTLDLQALITRRIQAAEGETLSALFNRLRAQTE
jgi:hypothetical protein